MVQWHPNTLMHCPWSWVSLQAYINKTLPFLIIRYPLFRYSAFWHRDYTHCEYIITLCALSIETIESVYIQVQAFQYVPSWHACTLVKEKKTILSLISRTTVTSRSAPNNGIRCNTRPLCINPRMLFEGVIKHACCTLEEKRSIVIFWLVKETEYK